MKRVKVFTNSENASYAGDELTKQIDKWQEANPIYEVVDTHTNSNKFGWMIAITYIDNTKK